MQACDFVINGVKAVLVTAGVNRTSDIACRYYIVNNPKTHLQVLKNLLSAGVVKVVAGGSGSGTQKKYFIFSW